MADAISEDCDLRRLGRELGVQTSYINRALETNWAGGRKTSNGNVMLLQNWAETVKPSKQLSILRAALQAAGLKEIEETCLQRKGDFNFGLKKLLRSALIRLDYLVKLEPQFTSLFGEPNLGMFCAR